MTLLSKYLSTTARFALPLAACVASAAAMTSPALAQDATALPTVDVNATRLNSGRIVGASTSVVTAEDIARSPNQTLPDILATLPGVQLHSLYGAVNGVGSVVDLRGFGAFATANTLVLINGRRINDIDLAGVDLSTIPLQSIERIEVTRGNSGAVLYGDNAIGGVINIVTKTGASVGKQIAMRTEAGVGSYGQREGNVSLSTNSGPWSTAVFGNAVRSDGYRVNNQLAQENGAGEIRYATPDFSAFLNLSGDKQHLGLPGTRSNHYTLNFVDYFSQLGDLRGSSTPLDYADKTGANLTTGFTKSLWNGAELIVDGGFRNKQQKSGFFGDPASPFGLNYSYVDSTLQTWSITPRLSIKNSFFGFTSNILTGIDYYDATYESKRSQQISDPPNHIYNLSQKTIAGYWQQTIGLLPTTDFSYGGRIQHMSLDARDHYDPLAPFGSLAAQATPLNTEETNHALHIGFEHRFNENFTVFGRAAQAFRTPNVDERVVTGPAYDTSVFPAIPIPQNFALKTQTSHDVEAGVRIHGGPLDIQTSFYDMRLKNEIHFNPVLFYNYNLDPTHRYGSETNVSFQVNESLRLKGNFSYTRAVFSEGLFTGKDVPLVSPLSGSVGLSWNVWQKYVVFDANARFWSSRRMDNDQANTQATIPANATLDLKLSGELDRFFWSAAIINVFDVQYYDYSIASATTPGAYAFYPLPGRLFMLKAGMTF